MADKPTLFTRALDAIGIRSSSDRPTYGYGGITGGGIRNPRSGMGTSVDKSEGGYFLPTRFYSRYPLEVVCVQSWAARKAVECRVKDMFLQRRHFEGVTDDVGTKINEAVAESQLDNRVRDLAVAANQYGTGLLVMMTAEADLEEPLEVERIREGDLKTLQVYSRYDASVNDREYDPFSPNFRRPEFYNIHPRYGGDSFRVHHSRVVRMDGLRNPAGPYTAYEQDWGVSILVPVLTAILQEAGLSQAAAHLVHEASIPVLEIDNLRESIAGQVPGELTVEQIGEAINDGKSNYRLMMLEKGAEAFNRIAVQFGGLGDLFDKQARRIAAATDIPFTRFMQDSPKGMNATGDGDYRNYIMSIEAERKNGLTEVYRVLDEVIWRSYGLGDTVPEYEWPSMLETKERSERQHQDVLSVVEAVNSGLIDEDEGRAALDGTELFGELPGDAPGLPEPEIPPLPGAAPAPKPPGGDKPKPKPSGNGNGNGGNK